MQEEVGLRCVRQSSLVFSISAPDLKRVASLLLRCQSEHTALCLGLQCCAQRHVSPHSSITICIYSNFFLYLSIATCRSAKALCIAHSDILLVKHSVGSSLCKHTYCQDLKLSPQKDALHNATVFCTYAWLWPLQITSRFTGQAFLGEFKYNLTTFPSCTGTLRPSLFQSI